MPRPSARPALFACFILSMLFVTHASAGGNGSKGDGWVVAAKARTPEDISLWTRVVPGAELKAFRGETHTDAPIENVIALLHDTASMPEWIFRCREASIVGEDPNGDTYVYMKVKGIWPLEDRDAIVHVHPDYDAKTGEITMTGTAAPDYLPKSPDYVRIPSIESTWRLTPTENGLVRIVWEGHVDPAGNVPRWLANSVATLVPRFTLRSARDLLQEPARRSPAQHDVGAALIEQFRARQRSP